MYIFYPIIGTWCDNCACSSFKRVSNGVCGNCAHNESDHSELQYRNIMLIVQELALGGELFGILMHTGPFDEDIARYYFKQLMNGLDHIHRQKISHRDLKPENLVLDDHFNLKIVDFGLASLGHNTDNNNNGKPNEDNDPTATSPPESDSPSNSNSNSNNNTNNPIHTDSNIRQTPVIPDDGVVHHSGVGSQPYSAPEVYYVKELYGGKAYKGAPADIWSCAVILFVMLTGRPPFVRPLARTYAGAHLRKCRHFVNVLSGDGLDMLSPDAKDLLKSMFQLVPEQRPSIQTILSHPWLQSSVPPTEVLQKIMEDKSKVVWAELDKPDLLSVLTKMRKKEELIPSTGYTPLHSPYCSPSASPSLGPQRSPSLSGMDQAPSLPASPLLSDTPAPVNCTPPFTPTSFNNMSGIIDSLPSTSAASTTESSSTISNNLFSLGNSNDPTSNNSSQTSSRSLRTQELEAREMAEKLRGEISPNVIGRSAIFGSSNNVHTSPILSSVSPSIPLQHAEDHQMGAPLSGVKDPLKKTYSTHVPSDVNSTLLHACKKSSAKKMSGKSRTRLPPAPRLSHTNSHPPRCHAPRFHGYTRFLSGLPFQSLLSALQQKLLNNGLSNDIEILKAGREWSIRVAGTYQSTTLACQIRISKIKSKEVNSNQKSGQLERGISSPITNPVPYEIPAPNTTIRYHTDGDALTKYLVDIHKIKAHDTVMFHTFVDELSKDLKE